MERERAPGIASLGMWLYLIVAPTIQPMPLPRTASGVLMSSTGSIDAQPEVLRQCTSSSNRPGLSDATQALTLVANAGIHPEGWTPGLRARKWRPVFSTKTGALKAAAADAFTDAIVEPSPAKAIDAAMTQNGPGCVKLRLARRASYRARPPAMMHSAEEVQTAAALVFPLLVYKAAALVQRNRLQWYLDASIALATLSLLIYAYS